jgi:hypothetical protein
MLKNALAAIGIVALLVGGAYTAWAVAGITMEVGGQQLTVNSGAKIVVESGGELDVESGGTLDHQSGGTLKLHGLTLSAAEVGIIDGATLGTSEASKAATYSAGHKHTVASGGEVEVASGGTLTAATGSIFDLHGAKFYAGKAAYGDAIMVPESDSTYRNLTNAIVQLSVPSPADSSYVTAYAVADDTTITWTVQSMESNAFIEPDSVAYLIGSWY